MRREASNYSTRSCYTHHIEFQVALLIVYVFGEENGEDSLRGQANSKYTRSNILNSEHLKWLVQHVDDEHAKGRSVNNASIRNSLYVNFNIDIHRTTLVT